MRKIVADPSHMEDHSPLHEARGSWRTTLAIVGVPSIAFLLVLALESWTGGRSPIEKAFVSAGLPLYGPFARGIVLDRTWVQDATVAWGLLLIWNLVVRFTPIGKWHWLIHGGIVALWFVVGFACMLLGGLAIS